MFWDRHRPGLIKIRPGLRPIFGCYKCGIQILSRAALQESLSKYLQRQGIFRILQLYNLQLNRESFINSIEGIILQRKAFCCSDASQFTSSPTQINPKSLRCQYQITFRINGNIIFFTKVRRPDSRWISNTTFFTSSLY